MGNAVPMRHRERSARRTLGAGGLLAVPLLLAGCPVSAPRLDVDASAVVDAGRWIPDGGPECLNHRPDPDPLLADPPFGTLVGRSFRDFTLSDCDGNPYEF